MYNDIKIYKKIKLKKEGEDQLFGRKSRSWNPLSRMDYWIYNKFKYTTFYRYYEMLFSIPISNFVNGISNLHKWIKIIWSDRNYDFSYIYTILQRKIELTRNNITKNNICDIETLDKLNRRMTICLNLIERIKYGYYETYYSKQVREKWNWDGIEFEPIYGSNEQLYTMKDTFSDGMTKEDIKNFEIELSNSYKKGNNKHEQAKRILFYIIENDIEMWWD